MTWLGVVMGVVMPAGIAHYSQQYQMPEQDVLPSYTRVMVMLETLRLTELFPKFTAAMIKVVVQGWWHCMGLAHSHMG